VIIESDSQILGASLVILSSVVKVDSIRVLCKRIDKSLDVTESEAYPLSDCDELTKASRRVMNLLSKFPSENAA